MTSTIQSLCISIPETLLHVTLKRRAEISADIFARLLRYFFLSCKNLTIIDTIINEVVYKQKKKLFVAFIDLKKEYDKIDREAQIIRIEK